MKYSLNGKRRPKSYVSYLYKIIIVVIAAVLILRYLVQNTSIFYRKDLTLPFSLHLNKQDVVLIKGEEFKLSVYGINVRVSYSSTNFRVAGVNFNGRVMAYQTGKAFILVKVKNKDKLLKCRVRVIDINKEKLKLKAGASYRLKIEGIFAFTSWKSSNPKVATVNAFGKVKAKSKGSTVITAKVKGKVVKCTVSVTKDD
jgi:hypothetical protein